MVTDDKMKPKFDIDVCYIILFCTKTSKMALYVVLIEQFESCLTSFLNLQYILLMTKLSQASLWTILTFAAIKLFMS